MAITPSSASRLLFSDGAQCLECQSLATHPRHAETPKHLRSFSVRDDIFGPRKITAFECPECDSVWRWSASQLWVCVAIPAPVMGQHLAGSGIRLPGPGLAAAMEQS